MAVNYVHRMTSAWGPGGLSVHIEMQPGAGQIPGLQSYQLPLYIIRSYIVDTCGMMLGGCGQRGRIYTQLSKILQIFDTLQTEDENQIYFMFYPQTKPSFFY